MAIASKSSLQGSRLETTGQAHFGVNCKSKVDKVAQKVNRVELKQVISETGAHSLTRRRRIHLFFFALFLAQGALVWIDLWAPVAGYWPEVLLLLFATLATFAWLRDQLPTQNVVLVWLTIVMIAGIVQSVGRTNLTQPGPSSPVPFHWAPPLIWFVVIVNARGVVTLVLRPWRESSTYGLWVLGLTGLFFLLLDLSFELFATGRSYWFWPATSPSLNWYGIPWSYFVKAEAASLLMLVLLTPWLINKAPAPWRPSFEPFFIWQVFSLILTTGAVLQRQWAAAILAGTQALLVLALLMFGKKRLMHRSQ